MLCGKKNVFKTCAKICKIVLSKNCAKDCKNCAKNHEKIVKNIWGILAQTCFWIL